MSKRIILVSFLVAGSLIGVSGCEEKAAKVNPLEKKVARLEEQIKKDKKAREAEKEKEEQLKEEKESVEVTVLDPQSKKVVKTFIPNSMGYGTDLQKYKKEIENWAKAAARGTQGMPGYDQRMIPDKLGPNGEIIKGRPRIILEESELMEKVLAASSNGGEVELPLLITESGYKPEESASLAEAVIASFTTRFNSSVAGRTRNIELSAQAINNTIIGTQDIFSFNTTVGPSDAAHGYQKAKEALNGQLVDGIGGGICQTSSTLYNAVDQLGVSYVEKHHHSLNVGYVPKGRDATVSYGGLDFRFQNTTGVPFLVKAGVDKAKGTLTVQIRTSKIYKGQTKR